MSSRLHSLVIETLGKRIVSGELAAGATTHAEHFESELGVSRSVMREAVRVLQSLGLVESVKRIGIRVLPPERWNSSTRRLSGGGWPQTARASSCARSRSCAPPSNPLPPNWQHSTPRRKCPPELMAIAARMRAVGRAGDLQHFLELDIQYHALVLAASGNEMFAQMHSMIAEVLRGRTDYGLMPTHPHEEALQLHVDVADAIQSGRPEAARQAMDQIMRRTIRGSPQRLGRRAPAVRRDRR